MFETLACESELNACFSDGWKELRQFVLGHLFCAEPALQKRAIDVVW